jgi:very-short-patch-repair endonuclease
MRAQSFTAEEERLNGIYNRLRDRLLDMRLSNPMLNYKHSAKSKRQLQVIDEVPEQVFRRLATDEDTFTVVALPEPEGTPADEQTDDFRAALEHARVSDGEYIAQVEKLESEGLDDEGELAAAETHLRVRLRKKLGMPPRPDRKTVNPIEYARTLGIDPSIELQSASDAPRHRDATLQTLKWPETLHATLEKVGSDARLAEQEMGLSTLFLVFGFLEWTDSRDSEKKLHAPLLLLPVRLNREKSPRGKITFELQANAGFPDVNLSLMKKLESVDVILPDFKADDASKTPIEDYFAAVTGAISDKQGWRVRRWLTLGHFAFGRLAMYTDLAPENWGETPVRSDLVSAVLRGSEISGDGGVGLSQPPDDHDIDLPEIEKKAPFLVHDADASQHSATIDVMNGANLVIQGPPGTGKSQTIANIIANALAAGKTVLFLAEKMAALEVVKRRLDNVDLGHFCLELHSDKASPKAVIQSLKQRDELGYRPHRDKITADPTWDEARRNIQSYLDALHTDTDVGKPFEQFWRAIRVRESHGEHLPAFRKKPFPTQIMQSAAAAEALFGEVQQYALMREEFEQAFGSVSASTWARIALPSDSSPGISYGLIDTLENVGAAAKAVFALCKESSILGWMTIADIELSAGIDAKLPPTAPDGSGIAAIAAIDVDSLQSLLRLSDERDAAKATLKPVVGIDLTDSGLRQLANNFGEQLSSKTQNQSPSSTYDEAGLTVANGDQLQAALSAARPALTRLRMDDDFPVTGLTALLVASLYMRRIPTATRTLAFGTAKSNAEELEAAAKEWRELTRAEQEWRTRFSAHSGPWPAVDALRAAEAIQMKSGIKGLLSWASGEGKITSSVNASLGLPPAVNLAADDYGRLADHAQKLAAFSVNKSFARLFGLHWRGLDTDVETVASDLALCEKMRKALLQSAGSNIVHEMLEVASLEDLEAISASFDDLVPWSKLDTTIRQLLGPATIASADSLLAVRRREAEAVLSLDPERRLASAEANWIEIAQAIGSFERLEACEGRFRAHPLASRANELTADRDLVAVVLEWLAAVDDAPASETLKSALRSKDAPQVRAGLKSKVAAAQPAIAELRSAVEAVAASYGVSGLDDDDPAALAERIDDLVGRRDELAQYLSLRAMRARLEASGLGPQLELADTLGIPPGEIPDLLSGVLAQQRAEAIRRSDPVLSAASGMALDTKRTDFARRDELKKKRDQKAVYNAVIGNQALRGDNYGSRKSWTESAALQNEFGKEKRFWPVRDVMSRAGRSIQSLKPCFMMSPLSLAKFIPAGELTFDLLVIDEASQMRPEDALGGLLRARQVVVVGDPKQLPPTDFFQRSVMTDGMGDGTDGDDEDDESILEACHKTFRQLRLLRWHYRSRCESLIAFSNKRIYEPEGRRLITFPAAQPGSFSIDRIRVQGHFQANCNPAEAQRIAEEAVRFMKEHADFEKPPTIGLVAMNGPQTELIKEELRLLETGDEVVERYREKVEKLGEPLFVKNLENVQGDERDFILISMTYGPRPNEKSVLQRFGPITGKQGHRRLNVLFTRARMRIGLVTSMDSSDIRPTETSSQGVHMLQGYLSYVEQGGREAGIATGHEPDSDFEVHVAERLSARGYEVMPQVGVSGFRIDLGILHPKHEGHYLAGIECDGAQYHSSRSARDRDRLRQEVLEGLGWRILRVWSTDWFDNPDRQVSLLADKLDALIDQPLRAGGAFTFARSGEPPRFEPPRSPESLQTALDFEAPADPAPGPSVAENDVQPSTPATTLDAETVETAEPWKNERFTPAEAKAALAAYRDAVVAPKTEDWEPERSVLRSGLIETFVEQRVMDDADWFAKVPNYLRRNTNAVEKKLFFDDICDIVSRTR